MPGSRRPPVARAIGDMIAPTIDPAVLAELARMGLGDDFLHAFVEQCLSDAQACQTALANASATGGWDEAREIARAYHGVAENLGADSIAERCARIERASDAALARQQAGWVADLSRHLAAVADLSRREVVRLNRARRGPDLREAPELS